MSFSFSARSEFLAWMSKVEKKIFFFFKCTSLPLLKQEQDSSVVKSAYQKKKFKKKCLLIWVFCLCTNIGLPALGIQIAMIPDYHTLRSLKTQFLPQDLFSAPWQGWLSLLPRTCWRRYCRPQPATIFAVLLILWNRWSNNKINSSLFLFLI